MAKLSGPRPGSAAHKAICRIVDLGGSAKMSALLGVLPVEYHSVGMFRRYVINVLADHALIFTEMCDVDVLRATPNGKEFAGKYVRTQLPTAGKYVGEIVPGRVASVPRPLNVAKHRAGAPSRAGSEDWRDIPSLMGGQRIAHKGSSN
ncbi:hypothetical protein ACO0LG_22585 [Undibacterium sp. Ji42W]|uniref:hypothetical protein n=1 Tax=Undibacterium sp. Ji42W TaxID=3413039 RepID=UPI003BF30241